MSNIHVCLRTNCQGRHPSATASAAASSASYTTGIESEYRMCGFNASPSRFPLQSIPRPLHYLSVTALFECHEICSIMLYPPRYDVDSDHVVAAAQIICCHRCLNHPVHIRIAITDCNTVVTFLVFFVRCCSSTNTTETVIIIANQLPYNHS